MKNSESRDTKEAARLAEILLSASSTSKVTATLEEIGVQEVQELCTTILSSGHTILHLLAQRQKLGSLRAVLQRGVHVHTRNAQGITALHVAFQHNALFSAKVLIDHGANVSEVISRKKGTTLLHLMVTCDRHHAVMLLLEEKADVNARDQQGRTPFHLAAIYGNSAIMAILIRHEHCDINAVDASGYTALMLAIINSNQELARQLVDAPRVDIVRRDKDGMSSLHLAVSLGQLEVVRTILRRNTANINSKERRMGRTPMHFACALECSKVGIVGSRRLIVDEGQTDGSSSPTSDELNGNIDDLSQAAMVNSDSDYIQDNGIDATSSDLNPESGSIQDVIKANGVILWQPSEASLPSTSNDDHEGLGKQQSAVHEPPQGSILRTSKGKSPTVATPRTSTPTPRLHFGKEPSLARKSTAVPSPRIKTSSKWQARHSISVDQPLGSPRPPQRNIFFTTPSKLKPDMEHGKVTRPSTAPAHQLYRQSASQSHRYPSLASPSTGRESANSHRSRESTVVSVTPFNVNIIRCKLVGLLLDHGADPNLMTLFRKSPLHITAIMGAADVMTLLLPHITNTNMLSASNKTALHLAVEGGFTAVVTQLIHARANLAMRDIAGMSALHLAASLGYLDIVSLLLKTKADKNACDFKQMTPLHHACLKNHNHVIDLLMEAGARTDVVDVDGFLPLQYRKPTAVTITAPERAESNISKLMRRRKTGFVYNINDNALVHALNGSSPQLSTELRNGNVIPQAI